MSDERLHPLLARYGGEAVADEGLDARRAADAPRDPVGGAPATGGPAFLADYAGDPDDLSAQRWAVVLPAGREDRYEAIAELVARRGAEAPLRRPYVVPRGADPAAWRRDVYLDEAVPEEERPRYLLILGDLDELGPEWQQALSVDAFVGRLAFATPEEHAAYAAKVVAAEATPPRPATALFYTAHDGTRATFTGFRALARPCREAAERALDAAQWPLADVLEIGAPGDPAAGALRAAAATPAAVLLSVSHGLGAPKGGWASPADQRALQGALRLAADRCLDVAAVGAEPFLPHGLWLFMACFSAGTPATSAYERWLGGLPDAGDLVRAALESLPAPGVPPFVAALPRAALANPRGPLGVVGHVDLAWSYAFQETDGRSRASRFTGVLRAAVRGKRLGPATDVLLRHGRAASEALADLEAAGAPPVKRAQAWMERQDVRGYVLLGDPAARLPTR